jgi:hypothetical protein
MPTYNYPDRAALAQFADEVTPLPQLPQLHVLKNQPLQRHVRGVVVMVVVVVGWGDLGSAERTAFLTLGAAAVLTGRRTGVVGSPRNTTLPTTHLTTTKRPKQRALITML